MIKLFKNEETRQMSPIIILSAIIQLFFIIILIAIVSNINYEDKITERNDEPKSSIQELASLIDDFPSEYVDDIEHSLTETIIQNTDDFTTSGATALIREGSLKIEKFERHGFGALSLIVDIPSLQQSYQIFYKFALKYKDVADIAYHGNPRAVLCLDDFTEIKYPDFKCRGTFPPETRRKIVADYLKFFDFDSFTAFADTSDPSIIYLNPAVPNPTKDEKATNIAKLKDKISSLGISPELFKYQFLTQEDLNYKVIRPNN